MNETKDISTERTEKRAKAIAAMGLVDRVGDHFRVSVPSLRGKKNPFEVRRSGSGKVVCSCSDFAEGLDFRCEHIQAVKFALTAKNTEPAARPGEFPAASLADVIESPALAASDLADANTTESRESERGEQEHEAVSIQVSENGRSENVKEDTPRLSNTRGKNKMKENKAALTKSNESENDIETADNTGNVLEFSATLRELRKHVDPNLVRQREGWRDRNGRVQMVEYIEWHTVADILDETAPNWGHSIKDMRTFDNIIAVTVAITIDGVTREGIGTGTVNSEMGIKKAEHDALKRAAVKFGIARDLYRKEFDEFDQVESVPAANGRAMGAAENGSGEFAGDPVAQRLSDLVTTKQLGMIRALAREKLVDPDNECFAVMKCKTGELSRRAASNFIEHLQGLPSQSAGQPLRRAS
jgi:hypothetical protein